MDRLEEPYQLPSGSHKKRKPAASLQPDDLPPLASFLDDNGSLGRLLRPANELKLRCTEFDENGNVTLVNGEFKKSELIAKIDSSLLPHILVRPSAILLNLLHLRVLIKYNRVLVFDAYGSTDSYTQSVFMYDLEGKLRQKESRISAGSLPYEFRALEAVLISVTTGLESEFEGVREPVVRVLKELEEDIDRDKLRYLLIYSKKLGTFEQKARLVRDALDELLEADDDLAAMYLTEKAAGKERTEEEHEEVELLLESYHKVADEIVQAAENLVSSIRNTEEIVKAILDANRNSLMLLDLKFSIGTLGLGAGTFVAALYGMNLKNFIEESDLGFWGVSAWCAVFTAIVCSVGLNRLRKVQRVSMWGEGYQHGSPGPRGMNGGGALGPPPAGVGPFPGASVGASVAGLRGPEKRVERWRKAKELQATPLRKRRGPGVESAETAGTSTATGLGASAGAAVGLGTVTGGQEPQHRGMGDSEWPAHVGTPKPM
ncbi:magnesium ion transporter [Coniosporium tulheliwenetii]|uniref:Magnesium ion transporter n=1 Tax=Coniosporium tulheliwenetii TaxID=3383036 RepID=A0ACC2YJ62_9PEZI|nr:magnesium ion transporter [Cladosporium sp. JES 115]